MAYIGNRTSQGYVTITKDSFSGNNSNTDFTLSKSATVNEIEVFVENVRQEPTTAYTVSGTTLSFTGTPPTGTNNIYVIHSGNTVSSSTYPAAYDLSAVKGTFTGTVDINGNELILDADADTSITADTDDQIDIKVSGADDFRITANTLTALSGSSIATDTISETTSAAGVTIDSVILKDGTVDVNGTSDGIILDADGDTTISADTDDRIDFKTAGSDKVSILSGGTLCIGQTAARSTFDEDVTPRLQIEGDGTKATFPALGIGRYSNNAYGGGIYMTKTRGTSFDADTVVQDDDTLGFIYFQGTDGTDSVGAAMIKSEVDGTPGSNDMPGRLVFSTTADGAAAPTERMRIDSSGNIGIGTTDPTSQHSPELVVSAGSNGGITVYNADSAHAGGISFSDATSGTGRYAGYIQYEHNTNAMTFGTSSSEKMRIASGGHVGIGTSSNTSTRLYVKSDGAAENTAYFEGNNQDDGHTLVLYTWHAQSGNLLRVYQDSTASDGIPVFIHTDAGITPVYINRNLDDGNLIDLRQGGSQEGSISVSGATVSYNAFTGSHWSRLIDNSKPTILRGTVMETLDEMCVWYHLKYTIPAVLWEEGDEDIPEGKKVGDEHYGEQVIKEPYAKPDNKNVGDKIDYDHKGTTYEATIEKAEDVKHVMCKISDNADCTNVYGVFLDWDNDDDSVNDMYVSAVGTNLVRIHKDQTVSKGDLLSSNGDGTAKKQDDDIIRSKTIGKVLSNIKQETYSDGSYTVPCALYCG